MKKYLVLIALFSVSLCIGQASISSIASDVATAQKIAEDHLKTNKIPGMAISVSKNGKLIWSEGFGYSNIEIKRKVDPAKTQFRIASISKPLTAAALAKLMDDGKIQLDKSIYTYLPDYPKKQFDFSIRQIGGHLAGIRHYKKGEFMSNKKMTITEGINIFKDDPLLSEPGTKFSYSTYGWNLLSEVIQKVAQTPFNDYIKEHIFDPLDMSHTTLDVSDSLMPNRTQFYNKTNAQNIVLGPEVSNEHKVAGGGFLSTSEDLINFGNEIILPKILSQKSVNELVTSLSNSNGKSTGYGVGFSVSKTEKGTPKYAHSGGGVGASTLLVIYPKEKIVMVLLMNLSQAPGRDFSKTLEKIFID